MNTEAAELKKGAARYLLHANAPYHDAALYRCAIVWDDKADDAAAMDNRWRVVLNPANAEFEKWTVEELAAVLGHELWHGLLCHGERYEALALYKNPTLWNMAADLEINDGFNLGNLRLPDGCLMPSQFCFPNGLTAEQYLLLLVENNVNPASYQLSVCSGACGSVVTQSAESGDAHDNNQQVAPGMSGIEIAMTRRAVAEAVKVCGNVPAGLKQWAEALLEPSKTPWHRVLAQYLRQTVDKIRGSGESSFAVPSRRRYPGALMWPGKIMDKREIDLAAVLDVSGSISERGIGTELRELRAILRTLDVRVRYLSCDTCATEARDIISADQLEIVGRGGTNMGEGIKVAEALHPAPAVILVFTDAYTPWPKEAPKYPTIICLVDAYTKRDLPKWAKAVIEIEE